MNPVTESPVRSVTVYCSSSNAVDQKFVDAAESFGRLIAEQGIRLIYGGGDVGLMGKMARAVHAHDGDVVGVIPKALMKVEGVAYQACDELHITDTMRERKRIMYERGDAFVVLAGGFGTLEEFLEVLTLRQLGYHDRPIVLVNTDGYYDTLLTFFDEMIRSRFSRLDRPSFGVVATPAEAVAALSTHD